MKTLLIALAMMLLAGINLASAEDMKSENYHIQGGTFNNFELNGAQSENYKLGGHSTPEQKPTIDNEFDIGGGLWSNPNAGSDGYWLYAEDKIQSSKISTLLFDGYLTPRVGLYARGDLGKTDEEYKWNNLGIGPQAGIIWTGKTDSGYPHQIQLMGRVLFESDCGKNKSSGYKKTEDHTIPGYYFEYLRQFQPEWWWMFYSEGWFDGSGSFESTWAKDSISNRTTLVFGGKIHKDFTPEWAGRLGTQYGLANDNNRTGINVNAEARYKETLMFGPSFDYTLQSDNSVEEKSWSIGIFVRIETHQLF